MPLLGSQAVLTIDSSPIPKVLRFDFPSKNFPRIDITNIDSTEVEKMYALPDVAKVKGRVLYDSCETYMAFLGWQDEKTAQSCTAELSDGFTVDFDMVILDVMLPVDGGNERIVFDFEGEVSPSSISPSGCGSGS